MKLGEVVINLQLKQFLSQLDEKQKSLMLLMDASSVKILLMYVLLRDR